MNPTDNSPLADLAARPTYKSIAGISIRYAESPSGVSDALLLSPWPESIFAYEAVWPRLAAGTHLVAIDLPGFGRSERRNSLMSPCAMGEFIAQAADAFGLECPHVIAPDVGTSAALFAASGHPKRFLSLVVGTGGAEVPIQLGSPLREWVFAHDLEPYRRLGGHAVVERALSTLERYSPTETARRDYFASYEGDRFAESMRYVQAYPKELALLGELLPGIQTRVMVVNGKRDAVVPPSNAEYLHERLPFSELRLIDAGHFLWEDAAEEYSSLVRNWWDGGYRRLNDLAQRTTPQFGTGVRG